MDFCEKSVKMLMRQHLISQGLRERFTNFSINPDTFATHYKLSDFRHFHLFIEFLTTLFHGKI